jgi:hypothetical protein
VFGLVDSDMTGLKVRLVVMLCFTIIMFVFVNAFPTHLVGGRYESEGHTLPGRWSLFSPFSDCKMSSAGDAIVETCCRQAQLAKGRKEEKNYKMQLFRSCHTSFVAFVRFSFAFVACREGNPSFVVG